MIDVEGNRIDVLPFVTINIRNLGTMIAHNGWEKRVLSGHSLHVFPGGVLQSNYLEILADEIQVDVLGSIHVDGSGYASMGQYITSADMKLLSPVCFDYQNG